MIIGITGTDGAGKGAVVEYLVKHKGFTHYSARSLFIEEIQKRGMESNRANMRIVANDLRRIHGNDYVVASSLVKAKKAGHKHIVIESIRAFAEAETLKQHGGVLLCVDADQMIRYERVKKRASSSDDVSFEEFVFLETREMNDPDPNGMQKEKVMKSADYTIENNISLDDLYAQIDVFHKKFS